jgi:hypothetical protein
MKLILYTVGGLLIILIKLNISKTKVISFSRKTNVLIYNYKTCQFSITRTDAIEDMGIFIDTKLHLHNIFLLIVYIKLLNLVRSITFTFSPLEYMYRLYVYYLFFPLALQPTFGPWPTSMKLSVSPQLTRSWTFGRTPSTGDQLVARRLPVHKDRKTHIHKH